MRAILLVLLMVPSCGGSPDNEAPTPGPAEREIHPFAMPVTTPVRVGEHLRNELDKQQADRDRRNADLESLLQPR